MSVIGGIIGKSWGKFWSIGCLRDLGVVVLLFVLALLVFRTDLMEGRIYYEPDTGTYYYPVMSAVDRAVDRSSLPLWTRHIFGGYPLFADGEGGALYPPNLLLLWLLPIQQAFLLLRVVRFFLAGVFLYAYCRTLGIGRHGALAGALAFSYGSFMVGQLQHTNLSNGAVWLPAVFLFVEAALMSSGRRRYFHLLLAGVAVAMQSLAVHVQPLILTLFGLSLYVAFRTVIWRGIDAWVARASASRLCDLRTATKGACGGVPSAGLVLALVLAVGLGLAAVQLIPLYELGQASARGAGPTYWFASLYGLPVFNVVTLILPYFFVGPDGNGWSLWTVYESTVYAGIAPFILAVLTLFFVRRRLAIFFGFLAALSLFLAFGDYPGVKLYWLLWQLPGFHFLRAPGRFSFLFIFAVAVLAAMGLDWLVRVLGNRENRLERNLTVKLGLYAIAVIALAVGVLSCQLLLREIMQSNASASVDFIQKQYLTMRNWNWGLNAEGVYKSLLRSLDISTPATLRAYLFLFSSSLLLLLWLRFRRLTRVWVLLLLAVILVDLLVFAVEFHPRATFSALSTPSGVTKFLVENNGMHRVYNRGYIRATEPNRLMAWSVSVVGGYSSLSPMRNNDFNKLIDRGNLRLLDLWNVRYVVATKGEPVLPEYRVVYQQDDAIIYENPHFLPRAFLVGSAVVMLNGQAALNKIAENSFDPSRAVVLEEDFDTSLLAGNGLTTAGSEADKPQPGESRIVEYGPDSALISTSSRGNTFLVLTDSFYPGWKTYVDGQEAKIYRADYLFRAVFLPAGSHEVVFSFEPTSYYLGRAVSLATLLLVAAAFIFVIPARSRLGWIRMNRVSGRASSCPSSPSAVIAAAESNSPIQAGEYTPLGTIGTQH